MSSHVFGPVPSRRLGRSLGVDLVPFKTCTFDCVYCQLGRTTCKTTQRREWVPLKEVLRDVAANLDTEPDFITLSGSGEPALFSRLNELICGIKDLTSVPVAVLTNGALLWIPEVRAARAGQSGRHSAREDAPAADDGGPLAAQAEKVFEISRIRHRSLPSI